jgi:oxalate decarboxylase/phosphoglucose isomerase-like protein (cupin superfamily)
VIKPWGYEIILSPEESPVTGKILHLDDGKRFSFQYHDKKMETLTLIQGEAKMILENKQGKLEEIKMELNKGYFIRPFQKHRAQGINNCLIFESSTNEEGNTVRLEDDYSRGTETEEARKERSEEKIYMG